MTSPSSPETLAPEQTKGSSRRKTATGLAAGFLSVNLKDPSASLEKQKAAADVYLTSQGESASYEEILPVWQEMFEIILQNKDALKMALLDPLHLSFEEGSLILRVNSKAQESLWAEEKPQVIAFLHRRLSKAIPPIKTLIERIVVQSTPYTIEEKVMALVEAHPHLQQVIHILQLKAEG